MSIRGVHTLFKDLLPEENPASQIASKKGRSSELNERRNTCLSERYYFIVRNNPKMKYEAIIEQVANEFFISVHTVPDILSTNVSHIQKLKQLNPSPSYFKKRWAHLNW